MLVPRLLGERLAPPDQLSRRQHTRLPPKWQLPQCFQKSLSERSWRDDYLSEDLAIFNYPQRFAGLIQRIDAIYRRVHPPVLNHGHKAF